MYIATNQETCTEIQKILDAQADKPKTVRVFLAGMGCSGPSYGLGLDPVKETDITEEQFGIQFVMDKDIYEAAGEIRVEWMGNGYMVIPVNQPESACSSCSGSCG